jgi:hypothetical protein
MNRDAVPEIFIEFLSIVNSNSIDSAILTEMHVAPAIIAAIDCGAQVDIFKKVKQPMLHITAT